MPRRRRSVRLGAVAGLLGLLALLGQGTAGAEVAATAAPGAVSAADNQAALAFWTPERMRAATPLPPPPGAVKGMAQAPSASRAVPPAGPAGTARPATVGRLFFLRLNQLN